MLRGRSLSSKYNERGAALATVILISFLLGTACIAMLTAVGASSRNGTDVLSESKAYYAAESGIQAAINIFRFKNVNYDTAVNYPTLQYDAANFTAGIVYTNGKFVVSPDSSYSLQVRDPDHSANDIIYSTAGTFQQTDGTYAATFVAGTAPNTLTFSFEPQGSSTAYHPIINGQPFGAIKVVKAGTGATLSVPLGFRIDYITSDPRPGVRTIHGSIATNGAVTFTSGTNPPTYMLMGSTITLCASSAGCTAPNLSLPLSTLVAGVPARASVFATMTKLVPYRLELTSTGYGPSGAKKQLVSIIQRNFFNDVTSPNAITLQGPGNNMVFRPGTANTLDILGGSGPSVGVYDSAGLAAVTGAHTNGTLSPPPEIFSNDLPDWQQSPAALDSLVRQLRQAAQNSGRYFQGGPTSSQGWGNYTNGTGLTFCEGSCNVGNDGGGILVVTGTLSIPGNVAFKGLIIVTGKDNGNQDPGGLTRKGSGNAAITGNIVIAPYDPNNLGAGWYSPRYDQSGGAGDVINSAVAVDAAFDGASAITDFVLGVAEK